jgi:hypothetical protein
LLSGEAEKFLFEDIYQVEHSRMLDFFSMYLYSCYPP